MKSWWRKDAPPRSASGGAAASAAAPAGAAEHVLRHRLVLSYDALSEGVTADQILDRVLEAVPEPEDRYLHRTRTAAA